MKNFSGNLSISRGSHVVLVPDNMGKSEFMAGKHAQDPQDQLDRIDFSDGSQPRIWPGHLRLKRQETLPTRQRMEMGTGHEMITVYYIDGNRLLLTHYCEAGDQPRRQANSFDSKTNVIDFQFLDVTNLPNPDGGHMHHAVITFHGPSEVDEDWTFYQGGKSRFTVPFVYHRVDQEPC